MVFEYIDIFNSFYFKYKWIVFISKTRVNSAKLIFVRKIWLHFGEISKVCLWNMTSLHSRVYFVTVLNTLDIVRKFSSLDYTFFVIEVLNLVIVKKVKNILDYFLISVEHKKS